MKDVPVFDGLGEGRDATRGGGFQAMSFSAAEAGAEVLFVSVSGSITVSVTSTASHHNRNERMNHRYGRANTVSFGIVEGSQDGLVFRQVGLDHFSDGDQVGPVGSAALLFGHRH